MTTLGLRVVVRVGVWRLIEKTAGEAEMEGGGGEGGNEGGEEVDIGEETRERRRKMRRGRRWISRCR